MFDAMGFPDRDELDLMDARFDGWVRERMERGEYLHWFATEADGRIVAGAGLWLMDWPPHAIDPASRRGNILNVYTDPDYRRRGLARQLTQAALDWCRENGIRTIILHASNEGRALYESLGFKATNEMRIQL